MGSFRRQLDQSRRSRNDPTASSVSTTLVAVRLLLSEKRSSVSQFRKHHQHHCDAKHCDANRYGGCTAEGKNPSPIDGEGDQRCPEHATRPLAQEEKPQGSQDPRQCPDPKANLDRQRCLNATRRRSPSRNHADIRQENHSADGVPRNGKGGKNPEPRTCPHEPAPLSCLICANLSRQAGQGKNVTARPLIPAAPIAPSLPSARSSC